MPGVDISECVRLGVKDAIHDREKNALMGIGENTAIYLTDHIFRITGLFAGISADQCPAHGHIERGAGTLITDIRNDHAKFVIFELDEIIKVAGCFMRWQEHACNLVASQGRGMGWDKCILHPPSFRQLLSDLAVSDGLSF